MEQCPAIVMPQRANVDEVGFEPTSLVRGTDLQSAEPANCSTHPFLSENKSPLRMIVEGIYVSYRYLNRTLT